MIAYIDPNTTQTVFTGLSSLMVIVGVIVNIILWPLLFLKTKFVYFLKKLPVAWRIVIVTAAILCAVGASIFAAFLILSKQLI